MALDIQIATGSSTPIYWQIVDHVTRAVANGQLMPGDQLPSVRSLADMLVVNPNTVNRAYGDLTRDGVIESRRGIGVFVADRRTVLTDQERERILGQAVEVFLHDIRLLDFEITEVVSRLRSEWPHFAAAAKE